MIKDFAEALVYVVRSILDSFSLSGAIIAMLGTFIVIGLVMSSHGDPQGEKVWSTFTTALTTFVSAKKVTQYEAENQAKLNSVERAPTVQPIPEVK